MVIYYDSKTGNVERFIRKLQTRIPCRCIKISEDLYIDKPGHLITYTTKIGSVPQLTEGFLNHNSEYILSVSSSGNMNWGQNYGLAANKISEEYNIPLLLKFELSGLEYDVNEFILKANKYADQEVDTPQ